MGSATAFSGVSTFRSRVIPQILVYSFGEVKALAGVPVMSNGADLDLVGVFDKMLSAALKEVRKARASIQPPPHPIRFPARVCRAPPPATGTRPPTRRDAHPLVGGAARAVARLTPIRQGFAALGSRPRRDDVDPGPAHRHGLNSFPRVGTAVVGRRLRGILEGGLEPCPPPRSRHCSCRRPRPS